MELQVTGDGLEGWMKGSHKGNAYLTTQRVRWLSPVTGWDPCQYGYVLDPSEKEDYGGGVVLSTAVLWKSSVPP